MFVKSKGPTSSLPPAPTLLKKKTTTQTEKKVDNVAKTGQNSLFGRVTQSVTVFMKKSEKKKVQNAPEPTNLIRNENTVPASAPETPNNRRFSVSKEVQRVAQSYTVFLKKGQGLDFKPNNPNYMKPEATQKIAPREEEDLAWKEVTLFKNRCLDELLRTKLISSEQKGEADTFEPAMKKIEAESGKELNDVLNNSEVCEELEKLREIYTEKLKLNSREIARELFVPIFKVTEGIVKNSKSDSSIGKFTSVVKQTYANEYDKEKHIHDEFVANYLILHFVVQELERNAQTSILENKRRAGVLFKSVAEQIRSTARNNLIVCMFRHMH